MRSRWIGGMMTMVCAITVPGLSAQVAPGQVRSQTLEVGIQQREAERMQTELRRIAAEAQRLQLGQQRIQSRLQPRWAQMRAQADHRRATTLTRPPRIREGWLPQDPADSLYRAARAALNDQAYRRSAETFERLRASYPSSGYVPDSYYFQALALQRAGGRNALNQARELLALQMDRYPSAGTQSESRALSLRIAAALARYGDARAAMEVNQQARNQCDPRDAGLRATALHALIRMDSEEATPILMEVLRDTDECSSELREQALFILAQQEDAGPELVDLLLDLSFHNPDPDPAIRESAVFWLSRVEGPEALDALEAILHASDGDPQLQSQAVFALSQQPSERAGRILRDFVLSGDPSPEVLEAAVVWIGHNEQLGGAGFLRELYDGVDDPGLREQIMLGVAQSGDEADHAWLLQRVRDPSEDPAVRATALFWVAERGGLSAADLEDMYDSTEEVELREQLIFALSRLDDESVIDTMMRIAETEDEPDLREQAIFWLGQKDDPRIAPFLLRIIRGGKVR